MSTLCDLVTNINQAFTAINAHFSTLFGFTNGESVIAPSSTPLINKGSQNPIMRIKDPDGFQIAHTTQAAISIHASTQPDGSASIITNQVVHPSVVRFPCPWHGYEWWMAITPYPGSDALYENPSIMVSHNGVNWIENPLIQNPVCPLPAGSINQGDNHLSYDPENDRLVMVYLRRSAGAQELRITFCNDGVNWSVPAVISTHPTLIKGSPNLVRFSSPAGVIKWRLYYNKATGGGSYAAHFRESLLPNGVAGSWDTVTEVECVHNNLGTGRVHWDFQMYSLAGGQWMDIAVASVGTEGIGTRPVMGISDDGITFNYGKPLLRRNIAGSPMDYIVYTTSLVPSLYGDVSFKAFVTGLQAGVGWGLMVSDLVPRPIGVVKGAQKIFEFNHRYNITPASGAIVTALAATPEGPAAATTINGATKPTRGTTGITFNGTDQYITWTAKPWSLTPAFTAICRFKPLGNPATATGQQTVFMIRNVLVALVPAAGAWQIWVMQGSNTSNFVAQLVIPYTEFLTIAVSWDGTVARFGSSLMHDYGGYQIGALTSINATGDVWIAGGANSGLPGGVMIDKLLIYDKATTENLEGLATSFDY